MASRHRRGLFMLFEDDKIPYYQKVLAIQPANLLSYWTMEDASGPTIDDKSSNEFNAAVESGTLTFGVAGIGDGKTAIRFPGNAWAGGQSAGYIAAWNGAEQTIAAWVKASGAGMWADSAYRYIIRFYAGADDRVAIFRTSANGIIRFEYMAGATTKYLDVTDLAYTDWVHFCITVSKTNDRLRAYVNGTQFGADITGLGVYAGTMEWMSIGSDGSNSWSGDMAHVCTWSKELTPAEVASLASPFDTKGILFIGDSKTDADAWRTKLIKNIYASSGNRFTETPSRIAISEATTAIIKARCDADIVDMKAQTGAVSPKEISINLGANDVNGALLADNFKTDTQYIISAYHTAYPSANIRLTKIWKRGGEVGIAIANGLIDELYAENTWLKTGINESLFLPGEDDGATTTTDGVHLSAAGGTLEAAALQAAMGY